MTQPNQPTQPAVPCDEADFIRGTALFTGNPTRSEMMALNDHALHCDRDDWYHALPTALWGAVKNERTYRERYNQ